jgi:two-component system chemotaxis sensor kinase CheA
MEEMDDLLRSLTATGVQVAALKRHLTEVRRLTAMSAALASRLQLKSRTGPRAGDAAELGLSVDLQHGLAGVARALEDTTERLEQELDETRQGADRLRLIPVQTLEAPLTRALRDAAQSLGKQVNFELEGGDLRLDAQLIGPLRDAFLHAVRNSVAHGVELPAERLRAGKPAQGTVKLTVTRHAGEVSWVLSDDGQGIDLSAVRRELVAREIVRADEQLSREDLLNRLFAGGITTSSTVTQISGRGIGLDVVRETVSRLKGKVVVESQSGVGTRIIIRVPISLSSVRVLLMETAGTTVAIPLESVQEVMRLDSAEIQQSPGGESLIHGARVVPYLPLARVLRQNESSIRRAATSIVLVLSGEHLAAVGVDSLLGTFELIVRPLPRGVIVDPVVAGVSLDAEGTPRLLLDATQLVSLAAANSPRVDPPLPARPPILVIDDSLTTRMLEQSILESAGYTVELADSADQGLEKARQKTYGVFLVDVEMPGMDGFQFVTLTRDDPELRKTPAILVTSRNAPEDLERGRTAGASSYVVKGEFDQNQLLATIEKLLSV